MKTKVFLTAILPVSLACLVGCSQQEDVNVNELAGQMASTSFEKTVTRSKTVTDGLTMQIVEWTIVDAEKHQIAPFGYVFGDGVAEEWPSVVYNYEQGDINEDGLGVHYTFTPLGQGEALNVLYWGNSLIIKNDTISNASAPIANLKKIVADLPNTKWHFEKSEYYILYDTLEKTDTIIKPVKRPDPVTGKPIIVMDTTVKVVKEYLQDTLGATSLIMSDYAILRDPSSKANTLTITKYEEKKKVNDAGDALVADGEPTTVTTTYHWGVASMTSAKRFVLNIKDDKTGEMSQLRLSGFDKGKGLLTIGNDEHKIVNE